MLDTHPLPATSDELWESLNGRAQRWVSEASKHLDAIRVRCAEEIADAENELRAARTNLHNVQGLAPR